MADLEVLTVEEASELTGGKIPEWRLWEQCRLGHLPHRRIGHRIYIVKKNFTAWLGATDDVALPSGVA